MKVLIAEDNLMWSTLLVNNIRQWGFDPIVVTDSDQALREIQADDSIRLAVLDRKMPGGDGIEVCRRIKSDIHRSFTYVVMLTGLDTKEDVVEGLDAGADDYLTKPVEMDVLRSRLKAAKRIIEAIPPSGWTKPNIPGYDVHEVLGKGAFATVWRATDVKHQVEVAIKILRVDLATSRVFGRFAREIKIMQSLDHPYVAKIHDAKIDRNVGYYIMDLIQGGDLLQYAKREKISAKSRIEMIAKVCEGLDYTHRQGVLHRDLKFANIMVTESGQPKIVDFGISKSMFLANDDDVTATIDGAVFGTPMFMSPEQARGEVAVMDGRSDLYTAATMLYMLLLNRHPHDINHRSRSLTIETIAHGDVVPPTSFRPKFDLRFEKILLTALARDPEDRQATAGEFAQELWNFSRKLES
jgi:eukaryotic-like serine/threonine-protein kinase